MDRTWIFGDGTVAINQSVVTHQYSSAGNYPVQYVAQSNCYCADTFSMIVHVDPLPGPIIQCISTVCHNSWASYYVSDTCIHHYTWTVTGADSIHASNDSLYVLWGNCNSGFGTISLTTDCSAFCPYQSTIRVPVLPASAPITGERIACKGENYTYSVPYVPGTTYQWYGPDTVAGHYTPDSVSDADSHLFIHFATNVHHYPDTVYIAVAYNNTFLNCRGFSVLPVVIATGIVVSFTKGDSVICASDSLQLVAKSGNTTLLVSCNWAVYNSATNSLVDTVSHNPYYNSTTLSPGNYVIYTYRDTGFFCDVPYITVLTVLSPPVSVTAPVIGPDTVCPNIVNTYYSLPTDPSQYYLQWNAIQGTPSIGSGDRFPVAWSSPLPDTLELFQRMLQAPGCPSLPVLVPIYPITNIHPAITGDTTVCSDGIVSYKTSFAADNYQWLIFPSTSGSVKYGQGGDSISIQWNHFTTDTTAYLLLIGTKCTYPDSSIITIHINSTPVPFISVSPNPPICTGQGITFTSSLAGTLGAWNFGDGSSGESPADFTTHHFTKDSSFTVVLTVINPAGCPGTGTATTTVNVLPSPVAFLSTPQSTGHCGGGFTNNLYVTLQNLDGAGITYQFYNAGIPVTGSSNTYNATTIGDYYAIVTSSIGCSDTTNSIPIDSSSCGGGGDTACVTSDTIGFTQSIYCDSVVFTAVGNAGVTFGGWNFDNGSTGTVSPGYTLYAQAGYYHPTVSGSAPETGGGTCTVSYQGTVAVPLVANFLAQFSCQGNTGMHVSLIDISTYISPITTWSWTIGSFTYNTQDVDTPMAAGTYTVQLVISDGTNTCSISKTVVVPAAANATFTYIDSQCITLPIKLYATDTTNIYSYLWDFGDTSYSALQNTSKVYAQCYNPPVHGEGNDCWQAITLIVTDRFGCKSSKKDTVYYYEDQFDGVELTLSPDVLNVCAGTSTIVQVNTNPTRLFTGAHYKWNNGDTSSVGELTVNQTGNYSVTVTDSYSCSARTDGSSSLIFNNVQGFISGDTIYCKNTNTNLNIFEGFQYQYYWLYSINNLSGLPTTATTLSSGGYSFIQPINLSDTAYRVWAVIHDTIGGGLYCEDTIGPVNIRSFSAVPTPISHITECVGYHAAVFIETPPSPGIRTLWNTGLVSDTLITNIPGVYTAEYIDTNGCISASAAVDSALALPGFNEMVSGCYTFCLGDTPRLSVPADYSSLFVAWLRNDTALSSGLGQNINALQPGTYQLVLRNIIGCQDTSLPINITFVPCDSNCFNGASIYCSNCYLDSVSGKRYIQLLIRINDTIRSSMAVNVLSNDLTILNFNPSTLASNTGTSYLNIGALVDSSSGGQYCLIVSVNGCTQEFCINTTSLSCINVTAGHHREEMMTVKKRSKYKIINNR